MPQPHKNAPDYIDLLNLMGSLGSEYKVVVQFRIAIRRDRVEVIGETRGAPYDASAPVEHVALASFEVKRPRDMATTLYTLAWDLWCQHDGGGATAASRGAPYSWQGYPEVPRRREVK